MSASLTCPECGHSQLAPDSVLGHKVRCPSCRVVFRVTGSELKPAVQPGADEYSLEPAAPTPPPVERRAQNTPPVDRRPEIAPPAPVFKPVEASVPAEAPIKARASLPPWVYAALGFAGAMTLVSTVVLVFSLWRSPPRELAKAAQEESIARATAHPAPAGNSAESTEPTAAPAESPVATSEPTAPSAEAAPRVAQAEASRPPAPAAPPIAQPEAKESPEQAAPPLAQADANKPREQDSTPLAQSGPTKSAEQPNVTLIEHGKRASALVEVTFPDGHGSGTGFCINKSGLFITNSHVVERLFERKGDLHLVIDIGLKSQRRVPAKVLRTDDYVDLALLKTDADSRLVTLPLGDDKTLAETTPVLTFGFPFGQSLRIGHEQYPNCTVISSKVTALHGPKDRREGVQYDGQINPGNSGGAVLDAAGRVIGIAVATIPGKSINLAIPVGRLTDFLAAPGIVFNPPVLAYRDRSKPVNLSIRLELPAAGGKMPADVSVRVTIAHSKGDARANEVKPGRDGACKVQVTPVPRDPPTPVRAIEAMVEAKRGSTVLASVHRKIELVGAPPLVAQNDAEPEIFIIRTLPRPPGFGGFGPRIPGLGGLGPRIPGVGGLGRGMPGRGGSDDLIVVVPRAPSRRIVTQRGPSDEGMLAVKGMLDVTGKTQGAGKSIRPPSVAMGKAKIGDVSSQSGSGGVRRFVGHSNGLWCVAFSPDERQILTASHDLTVRLWDVATARQLRVFHGHTDHVKGVAFLPDGVRGISGADDDTLRLWDLRTGRELRRFLGHTADLSSVAVSPDGSRALSGACDKTVRLWDISTGRELRRLDGHTDSVTAVAFLPDGGRALSASPDGTVRSWDLETGRELHRFQGDSRGMIRVAASPDGRLAIGGGRDGIVRVWDVESGRELRRLNKHDDSVDCIAVTADGRKIISGGGDKDRTVRVWDLESGRQLQVLGKLAPNAASGLAVTRDGRKVLLATGGIAQLWDLPVPSNKADAAAPAEDPGQPLVRFPEAKISDVAVGGGGRYLILTLEDRKIAFFDVNAADIIKTITVDYDDVLVAGGARTVIIADRVKNLIDRYNLETMTFQARSLRLPIQGSLRGLALGSDSDGPLVVVWAPKNANPGIDASRFSFVDPKTLSVLKMGPISNGGFQGIGNVSPSGGSVTLHPFIRNSVHIRASAGGNLFGIWHTDSMPNGFQTLAVRGANLRGIYNHEDDGHLAPGPDGRTVYTGLGGVHDSEGKPVGQNATGPTGPILTIPSPDPAYYLGVAGLNRPRPGIRGNGTEIVQAIVYGTGRGDALFGVDDLQEMSSGPINESSISNDFTVDKRFHLIPAARLLVTIPYSNDRLVLRRLDVESATHKARP
jgi:WD40 repeat protein/S1-C subfamily serine protease